MKKPELKILDASDTNEEIEEVVAELPVIQEIKNFTDGEGRTIVGQFPIPDGKPSFTGAFMVGTTMGPVRLTMGFPENTPLVDCFEQFDALAQETVEQAQAEAKEQARIVTPDMLKGRGPQVTLT